MLVDLAGSEKYDSVMEHVSHANIKVQQLRKKECQEINTSLMCLGTVMRGLGQKQVRSVRLPAHDSLCLRLRLRLRTRRCSSVLTDTLPSLA